MFGYKLIKEDEIINLKLELEETRRNVASNKYLIDELTLKNKEYESIIKEYESIINDLTKPVNVKNEINENKPVKKVRRKQSKKTIKENNKKEE